MFFNIEKVDDYTIRIDGEMDTSTKDTLYSLFTYVHEKTAAYQKKSRGYVDKTHLFKKGAQVLPIGLLFELCFALRKLNIPFSVAEELKDVNMKEWVDVNYDEFIEKDFSGDFQPYPHQVKAIKSFLMKKKSFQEIATSAGKSFIIYVIACMLARQGGKVLIITDSTTLTEQLKEDILTYTKKKEYWRKRVKSINSQSKDSKYDKEGKIFISTYQSMNEEPEYFQDFTAIIVDEGHKAIGNSITEIINKCWHVDYRIGMCGKLEDTKEHRLKTSILFGHVSTTITAKDLINEGMATPIEIKMIRLKREKPIPTFNTYPEYSDFLNKDYTRMDYIVDHAINMNENLIILFNKRAFGKALFNTVKQRAEKQGKKFLIEYIDGEVPVADRVRIKESFQNNNNVILVASYKTIAVGINAPNLRTIIMAEPIKATITIVQSIGRVLRLYKGKKKATLIDYSDNYGWGDWHAKQRREIYANEKHTWENETVELGW